MSQKYFLPLLVLLTSPLLASCSTAIEGSTQQVSFKTVGADDAFCNVQTGTNDYRYDVRPPQSLWVQKSRKPMFVSCTAPGNRVQNVTVESEVAGTTFLNSLNAGLGGGWDATSGAMYKYPDEVIIDFSVVPAQGQVLPSYMNYGALPAKDQGIEYLGPDEPSLPTDKAQLESYKKAYENEAQMLAEKQALEAEKQRRMDNIEGGFYGDKTAPAVSGVLKEKEVVVAPLSEAVPQKPAAKTTEPVQLVPDPAEKGSSVVTPQEPPTLGQPIFPSSTSF